VKADHKNVTLSLPEPLLRKFRVYAASHNKSMTSLMTEAIERMIAPDDEYEAARTRLIEGMRNARDLGTGGKITWTRDEIHER
jgi:plasmid stability protein